MSLSKSPKALNPFLALTKSPSDSGTRSLVIYGSNEILLPTTIPRVSAYVRSLLTDYNIIKRELLIEAVGTDEVLVETIRAAETEAWTPILLSQRPNACSTYLKAELEAIAYGHAPVNPTALLIIHAGDAVLIDGLQTISRSGMEITLAGDLDRPKGLPGAVIFLPMDLLLAPPALDTPWLSQSSSRGEVVALPPSLVPWLIDQRLPRTDAGYIDLEWLNSRADRDFFIHPIMSYLLDSIFATLAIGMVVVEHIGQPMTVTNLTILLGHATINGHQSVSPTALLDLAYTNEYLYQEIEDNAVTYTPQPSLFQYLPAPVLHGGISALTLIHNDGGLGPIHVPGEAPIDDHRVSSAGRGERRVPSTQADQLGVGSSSAAGPSRTEGETTGEQGGTAGGQGGTVGGQGGTGKKRTRDVRDVGGPSKRR